MTDSHQHLWLRLLLACMLCVAGAATANTTDSPRYDIDPVATKTTYETKYLGFITVKGIFEKMTGVLRYDIAKPAQMRDGSIHVIIDATSIKPSNFDSDAKRQMMRGPDFFNVEKYPTIEFKSNKFRFDGEKLIAIDGMVTLVGMTKPTTLNVKTSRCDAATQTAPARCTASVEWIVKRFEFGINGWANTVSDEVKISVELVAIATNAAQDDASKRNDGVPLPTTTPSTTSR